MPKTMNEKEKREKARRVWRLNHEGEVPVLEALESVGLSKDVYYRIKREREEEWQEEVLTAEDLGEELEELKAEVADFADDVERYREVADDLDRLDDFAQIRHDMKYLAEEVLTLRVVIDNQSDEIDLGSRLGFDPTTMEVEGAAPRDEGISELRERVDRLEESVKSDRDEAIDGTKLRRRVDRLESEVERKPDGLMDLVS